MDIGFEKKGEQEGIFKGNYAIQRYIFPSKMKFFPKYLPYKSG